MDPNSKLVIFFLGYVSFIFAIGCFLKGCASDETDDELLRLHQESLNDEEQYQQLAFEYNEDHFHTEGHIDEI